MKDILSVFISALFLAAAIAGYGYLLVTIDSAMNAAATAKAEGAAAEDREKFARTAQTFLSGLAAEQAELATYVANDADFVAVIEAIEGAAAREGVKATIGSVNVLPGSAQFHEIVAVTASARGSFKNITSFVAALETLPLASKVTSAAFEVSADESWFATVTIEVIKRKQ